MTTTATIQRDGETQLVTVTYEYHKACRGMRDSLGGIRGAGPPLEPDEPAFVEIETVIGTVEGKEAELTLTEGELDFLSEQILEQHENNS